MVYYVRILIICKVISEVKIAKFSMELLIIRFTKIGYDCTVSKLWMCFFKDFFFLFAKTRLRRLIRVGRMYAFSLLITELAFLCPKLGQSENVLFF